MFLKNLSKESKYVLAVSGGVDSMVLLDMFSKEFGIDKLVVAHLDHGLRDTSVRDHDLVRRVCGDLGVKFVSERFEVGQLPGNVEANARQVRYNFLEKVRKDHGCDWIVTAHHGDDQVETIMTGFLKGTFLKGFSGMQSRCLDRKLLRPFLNFRKKDLYDYARENGISFFEDETNNDTGYDRNFLRSQVVPVLEERYEGLGNRLLGAASMYRELDEYLWKRVGMWCDEFCTLRDYGWEFELSEFVRLPLFMRFMVVQKLSGNVDVAGFGQAQFEDVDKMLSRGESGKWKGIGGSYVYIFDGKVLVSDYDLDGLHSWYDRTLMEDFGGELKLVVDHIVGFEDGMKVIAGDKEVALKKYLKEHGVPWFFRRAVKVLLDNKGRVSKCWVV